MATPRARSAQVERDMVCVLIYADEWGTREYFMARGGKEALVAAIEEAREHAVEQCTWHRYPADVAVGVRARFDGLIESLNAQAEWSNGRHPVSTRPGGGYDLLILGPDTNVLTFTGD